MPLFLLYVRNIKIHISTWSGFRWEFPQMKTKSLALWSKTNKIKCTDYIKEGQAGWIKWLLQHKAQTDCKCVTAVCLLCDRGERAVGSSWWWWLHVVSPGNSNTMHIDTQQTQLPPTLGILTTNTHAILVCKEDEEVMYLGSFGSISTTSANLIQ